MKVVLVRKHGEYPGSHPAIALWPDPWDDYGFKTTYAATLWISERKSYDLEKVKIMRLDMTEGRSILKPIYSDGLPEEFGSIGADFDYYQRVVEIEEYAEKILVALGDLVLDDDR